MRGLEGVRWGSAYWVVAGAVHQFDWETGPAGQPAKLSGLCICGRKSIPDRGGRPWPCKKVLHDIEAAARIAPDGLPSLRGWVVRLRWDWDGWRWHAWRDPAAPMYIAPDRNGRRKYGGSQGDASGLAELVRAVATAGALVVRIDGRFVDVCFGQDDLDSFGLLGVTVGVSYGHS